MKRTAVLFISIVCAVAADDTLAPVVQTTNGNVQGLIVNYPDGPALQYVGIPFAAPPIDSLRFQKPRPHPRWNTTLMATQFGPSCMQYIFSNDEWLVPNTNISEDCLQLNVFIPKAINKMQPKSVMIWIHGGGYTAGQATLFDGSYLALTGDVIIVTINYRLGLFGFLSTENAASPGNYGLWDQHFAFKWVRENIANFGGDPNSVCIFGESAGGFSVELHTISPVNRGYFQRAISESGALMSPGSLVRGARGVAMKAGTLLNCSTDSTVDLITCLRSKPATSLLQIQSKAWESSNELDFTSSSGPVLDGDFITEEPCNLLKNVSSPAYQMFKSVAVMAGTNNAEGGLMYFFLMDFQERFKFNVSVGIPRTVLCDLLAPAISRDYYNNNSAVSKAICEEYTVNGSATEQSRSIVDIFAHTQFVMPTIRTNVDHASTHTSPTYHYIFSHQPSFSWIQERPVWLKGANHAGELPFVFGLHAMYKNSSLKPQEELALSRQMMVYWSNFAKTGNPNRPVAGMPNWPAFETEQRRYMDLKINPQPGAKLLDEKYRFWTDTVPSLLSQGVHETTDVTTVDDGTNTGVRHTSTSILCGILVCLAVIISH